MATEWWKLGIRLSSGLTVLYAEFRYHKMASVNSLLVIVLILAATFPEVIETKAKNGCFPSEKWCKISKVHYYWCRRQCKSSGKSAIACHRKRRDCYGCHCYTSDALESPEIPQSELERNPLWYIYRLLKEYIRELRRKRKNQKKTKP